MFTTCYMLQVCLLLATCYRYVYYLLHVSGMFATCCMFQVCLLLATCFREHLPNVDHLMVLQKIDWGFVCTKWFVCLFIDTLPIEVHVL